MIIRFTMHLCERKRCKEVDMVFLVCGHTRNVCDRKFNDFKKSTIEIYITTDFDELNFDTVWLFDHGKHFQKN